MPNIKGKDVRWRGVMKKAFIIFVSIYFVYAIAISSYLYFFSSSELPIVYKGSSADPELFMTEKELKLSQEFSQIKNILYFIAIPIEWGGYLALLIFGLSHLFQRVANKLPFSILRTAIYVFLLSMFIKLIHLPLNFYSYKVSVKYGISTQSIASWFKDLLLSFTLNTVILTIIVATIYLLMKKFKEKWWLYSWLLSIPFTIFFMYIQPVVIAPLFNDFYPLQDEALKEEILHLAAEANVPAEQVYEVNMSEKTNAMNAYVTGIGDNLRIVLWDTTLERLQTDEVLYIMAHEIGHYVKKHLLLSLIGSIITTFIGLYISSRLLNWAVRKWGHEWEVKESYSLASLPALLLIFSLLTFISTPFANVISRYHEIEADKFAIEMTEDPDAAIGAFQQLTKAGLSDVNPPTIVKWIRYTHPTMLERLIFLENYRR
jgi:STE24 endopeptidase